MPNIANSISDAAKIAGEAVAKPVGDEASKMTQATVESLTGQTAKPSPQQQNSSQQSTQPTTQNPQQATLDATRKRNIEQFFDKMTQEERSLTQKRVQEAQTKKKKEDEEQEKKEIKQFEITQKQKAAVNRQVYEKQRQVEIKKGGL